MDVEKIRSDLLTVFDSAVQAVNGRESVRKALLSKSLPTHEIAVVAIGKAAVDMALGVQDVLGDQIGKGLVITKLAHLEQASGLTASFELLEAEHPVPGPGSLVAGDRLVSFCHDLGPVDTVIICISGGASSLVEQLPAGLKLQDIQELTESMLASGLDIERINAIRRKLSHIKGGRLASRLHGRDVIALYISDVPADDVSVIGSGLLAARKEATSALGNDLFQLPNMPVPLSPDSPVFDNISHEVVANLELAKSAACNRAIELGYEVVQHDEFLDQTVDLTATSIFDALSSAASGIHIWGGETVVNLPDNPGRGGRNQHLALCLAKMIQAEQGLVVLAAGTDGSDGVTGDAGAIVDAASIERGKSAGRSIDEDLAQFNANGFLEASGDLVSTGPTGTNVMDLLLVYKD